MKRRLVWVRGYTCYHNVVPFRMDGFERHLYLYYFYGINPSPKIEIKFKYSSANPVQGNNFLHKGLVSIM